MTYETDDSILLQILDFSTSKGVEVKEGFYPKPEVAATRIKMVTVAEDNFFTKSNFSIRGLWLRSF